MTQQTEASDKAERPRPQLWPLSAFERTVWCAWIVQQIVSAGHPEDDWSQVAARVALDYLAKHRPSAKARSAEVVRQKLQDHSNNDYVRLFLGLVGNIRGLATLDQSNRVAKAHEIMRADEKSMPAVYHTTRALLALMHERPQKASLSRARYLCQKKLDISASTVERSWKQYGQAAHLICAVGAVYHGRTPGLLLVSVTSPPRRKRSDDVTKIFLTARDIKNRLGSLAPKRSRHPLGAGIYAELMADPEGFKLWPFSPTLQAHLQSLQLEPFTPSLTGKEKSLLNEYSTVR